MNKKLGIDNFFSKYKSINKNILFGMIIFSLILIGSISYSGYKYYVIYKTKQDLHAQLDLLNIDRKALEGMESSLKAKKKDIDNRIESTFIGFNDQITKVSVVNYILDIKTNKQFIRVNLSYDFDNSDNVKDLVAKLYLSKDVYKIVKVDRTNIQIIVKGE